MPFLKRAYKGGPHFAALSSWNVFTSASRSMITSVPSPLTRIKTVSVGSCFRKHPTSLLVIPSVKYWNRNQREYYEVDTLSHTAVLCLQDLFVGSMRNLVISSVKYWNRNQREHYEVDTFSHTAVLCRQDLFAGSARQTSWWFQLWSTKTHKKRSCETDRYFYIFSFLVSSYLFVWFCFLLFASLLTFVELI